MVNGTLEMKSRGLVPLPAPFGKTIGLLIGKVGDWAPSGLARGSYPARAVAILHQADVLPRQVDSAGQQTESAND